LKTIQSFSRRSLPRPTLRALFLHLTIPARRSLIQVYFWMLALAIRTVTPFLYRFLGGIGISRPVKVASDKSPIFLIFKRFGPSWQTCVFEMETARQLMHQGFYRRAVNLRQSSLQRAYELSGLCVATHVPPALGPGFSSKIGHLGIAAWVAHAEAVGVLPRLNRLQLLSQRIGNEEVVRALSSSFTQVNLAERLTRKSRSWSKLYEAKLEPALWPWMERYDTIKTPEGFTDLHPFLENLGRNYSPDRNFALSASEEALERLDRLLFGLGVEPHDPMVALHIREFPAGHRDHRSAELNTFLPAVRELTGRGIKVLRFGSAHHSPLPKIPGLIDLVAVSQREHEHDFAAMSRAMFMVTTMSGPHTLACSMGLPTLVTNATSVGKIALSPSRYLPKRFVGESGRLLTLSENLQSPLGYWEQVLSAEIPRVPETIDSSDLDILLGVREMLAVVSGKETGFESLHNRAEQIRHETGAVAHGQFCGSFLERNEAWLA